MKRYLLHLLATIPLIFAACDKNGDGPDNPGTVEIENTVVTINTDGTTSSGVPFEWIPGSSDSEFSLNYITYKVDYANTQVIVSGANKDGLQNRLDGKASIPKSIIIDKITYPVTLIEQKAFYLCKELKSINIPEGVTKVGESAFHGCTNLTNIQLYNGLSEISKNAFNTCIKLEYIQIPNTITKLGEYAFANCHSLELFSDKLPLSIGDILEKGVFMNCSSIKKITIPEEMRIIAHSAFKGCSGLEEISVPEEMRTIEHSAFKGCSGLEEFTATNLTEIGDSVFDGCSNLKTISLPHLDDVGKAVFRNCSSLESITMNYRGAIPNALFQGCSSLKEINLFPEKPNFVNFGIGNYGLDGCTSLEKLCVRSELYSNHSLLGIDALRNCTSLKHLSLQVTNDSRFEIDKTALKNVFTENLYINFNFFYKYRSIYQGYGWNIKAKTVYLLGVYITERDVCKEIFQADTVIEGRSADYHYEQAFGYRY